jgi:hypothetical protein
VATNSRTFEVKFVGDIKGLKGAINDLQKQAGGLGKSFTGVSGVMKGALGALSFVGITAGFKNIIQGSKEAASDINRLRHILINASGATNRQVDALLAEADALEKVGVASKAHIIAAQSQLATFNLQASTIKTLTPAILNYVLAERGAAATIEDVKQMTNGLALALDGQFASLTRVGFVMDKATKDTIRFGSESERASAIVKVLDSTYAGFNESLAKTPEGRIILLNRAIGDLKNSIGQALLPVFMDLVDVFQYDILPVLKAFIDGLVGNKSLTTALTDSGKKAYAWGTVVTSVLNTIIQFKKPLMVIAAILATMWAATGIAGLITAIGTVIKAFNSLRAAAILTATAMIFGTGGASVVPSLAGVAAMVASIGGTMLAVNAITNKFSESIGNIPEIKAPEDFTGVLDDNGQGYDRLTDSTKKNEAAQKAVNDQIAKFKDLLSSANKIVEDAKNKFNDYAKSVANTFKDVINFGNAFDKSKDSIQDAQDALKNLAIAQYEYQQTLKTGSLEEQQRALLDLQNAQIEATRSVTNKKTFLETLQEQANNAQDFAKKVQQLISMGLSEAAIQQVLSAGAEAGSLIADEIIAGGTTIVDKVNSLIEATATVADQVGQYGAEQFYRAGITQGEALVRGILDAIRAAGLNVDAAGNITSPASAATNAAKSAVSQAKKTSSSYVPPSYVRKAPSTSSTGRGEYLNIPMMAAGGIVNRATLAMIGEAGPEAVIPLSQMNKSGGTYNITVNAGMGTNGALIGKEIVDAIKRYERSSGPVFASA